MINKLFGTIIIIHSSFKEFGSFTQPTMKDDIYRE